MFRFVEMAQALLAVIANYKQRLMAMPQAPRHSFGRAAFGVDGAVNRLFLMYLFLDLDIAIQFLKHTGLIPSQMTCPTCGLNLTWRPESQRRDQFRWRCRRRAATVCSASRSIKYGSWFDHSCLTFQEVLYLTYDIVHKVPANRTLHEYGFSSATVTDCRQFVREAMSDYLLDNPQKIGGPGKTVEIDGSKFGKRKYNRGHRVEGQWGRTRYW
jgi:hypothetical protein